MFFCPNCNNSYEIARSINDLQTGGSNNQNTFDDIIKAIITDNDIPDDTIEKIDVNLLLTPNNL